MFEFIEHKIKQYVKSFRMRDKYIRKQNRGENEMYVRTALAQ